jgi:hypothetical protein
LTELPGVCSEVHARIVQSVASGAPLWIGIDGGNTPGLLGGEKILAICRGGPGYDEDALVALKFLGSRHENTESQALAIHQTLISIGATRAQVRFIISDNAAVNFASISYLNSHYGWNVEMRRCLPHCLALVAGELIQPFEDEYGIAAFLTKARGAFNAGGGVAYKQYLLEAGVRLNKLDFTITRWGSFIQANSYLASMQCAEDLGAARKSMQLTVVHEREELKLALESERPESQKRIPDLRAELKSTEDALAEPDAAQPIWCALYEAMEAVKSSQKSGAKSQKKQLKLNSVALAAGEAAREELEVCSSHPCNYCRPVLANISVAFAG